MEEQNRHSHRGCIGSVACTWSGRGGGARPAGRRVAGAVDRGAAATQKVAQQIAGIQTNAQSVTDGIHVTSGTIGQMDAVQARINAVLEDQVCMAQLLERS